MGGIGAQSFFMYAVIFDAGSFYYFGGCIFTSSCSKDVATSILRLNAATWRWTSIGQLNSARRGHGVVLVGNAFMIIGGWGNKSNEACLLNDGNFTCEEKNSYLYDYKSTPLLFGVDDSHKLC